MNLAQSLIQQSLILILELADLELVFRLNFCLLSKLVLIAPEEVNYNSPLSGQFALLHFLFPLGFDNLHIVLHGSQCFFISCLPFVKQLLQIRVLGNNAIIKLLKLLNFALKEIILRLVFLSRFADRLGGSLLLMFNCL